MTLNREINGYIHALKVVIFVSDGMTILKTLNIVKNAPIWAQNVKQQRCYIFD